MANVVIDIATEFTGKKAFKQAETSVDKLNATTKNLGKTLTRTFGTAAILAFGRASVKAFVEDDKAATSLGQTLKNLNLAYGNNAGTVNGFISRLEQETGVLDDELRPAMDRLLRATMSVTKSQELLGLALDIAAGTGKTVTQVSQSLQKAFLGQTQALGRLGVGLTKAELASGSFEEIQQKLTTLFSGQASAAAQTYAGQLDKLTIAANNAKETIGKGLVEAIVAASGGTTGSATGGINNLATGIADTVKNVGELIGKLEKLKPVLIAVGLVAAAAFLPLTTAIAGAIFLLGDLNKRLNQQSFAKGIIPGGMGNVSMTGGTNQDTQRADKAAAAAAAKASAAQLKATQSLTKSTKENLKLAKAKAIFDLQKIQIEAALKGKISAEDRIRLLLMKAIADENVEMIDKYTKALNDAQAKAMDLQKTLDTIKSTTFQDPFAGWKSSAGNTTEAINEMVSAMFAVQTQIQRNGREWSSFANQIVNTQIQSNGREWSSQFSPSAENPLASIMTSTPPPMTTQQLQVVVNGSIIAEEDLKKAIVDAVNQSGLTGNQLITGTLDRQVAI